MKKETEPERIVVFLISLLVPVLSFFYLKEMPKEKCQANQARKAGKILLFLNILAPKDAPDSLKMCLESESSCLLVA